MEADELDFEAAFARLEEAVRVLERGELPLNELVAVYEESVRLSLRCTKLLDAAELRISLISQEADGSVVAVPMETAGRASESPTALA